MENYENIVDEYDKNKDLDNFNESMLVEFLKDEIVIMIKNNKIKEVIKKFISNGEIEYTGDVKEDDLVNKYIGLYYLSKYDYEKTYQFFTKLTQMDNSYIHYLIFELHNSENIVNTFFIKKYLNLNNTKFEDLSLEQKISYYEKEIDDILISLLVLNNIEPETINHYNDKANNNLNYPLNDFSVSNLIMNRIFNLITKKKFN